MNKLKLILMLLATTAAVSAPAGESSPTGRANATNRFAIAGMHCEGCAGGLAEELKGTRGVISAQVTFSNKLAVVAYDTNRVSRATLVKVAKAAGFEAKPVLP